MKLLHAEKFVIISLLYIFAGCGSSDSTKTSTSTSTTTAPPSGDRATSPTSGPVSATLRPTIPPSSDCPGRRLGQYSWGTELWRSGATELSDFFATEGGKQWGCGDLTINIGDYTAPEVIAYEADLIPFILRYRKSSNNYESVLWLSYGDTESGNGSFMLIFIDTFFAWAKTIPEDVIPKLGRIGLSFDVEHMPSDVTKQALQKAQALKSTTIFPEGSLLIQHTIEGHVNNEGTDYVMKYADSALMMLYRNYETSPIFNSDSNILSRAQWMLQSQCIKCLDDAYAAANYRAKITIMVEGSCAQFDYCAKLSFCVYDGSGDPNFTDPSGRVGAAQAWAVLEELESAMFSSGLVNGDQFKRLFNPLTTFAVHDWSWFRCYEPFPQFATYQQCASYNTAAAQCRAQLGPLSSTTLSP